MQYHVIITTNSITEKVKWLLGEVNQVFKELLLMRKKNSSLGTVGPECVIYWAGMVAGGFFCSFCW